MIKSKSFFFFATFVMKYFVAIPYLLYHAFLIYKADFKWIPHIVFIVLGLAAFLTQLYKEKMDKAFMQNPIEIHWKRKLPGLKVLLEKTFVFDDKYISKGDFYGLTGFLFGLPILGSFGVAIINIIFNKSIMDNNFIFILPLFMFPFGALLFFTSYLPAIKLCKRKKLENNPKPFWYCFSYNLHYSRQMHFFKQSTSDVRKHSGPITALLLVIALLLGIDIFLGSPFLLKWLHSNRKPNPGGDNGIIFLQAGLFFMTTVESLKYFYMNDLIEDAKKEIK